MSVARELGGLVALVTGSSRNIGKAIAVSLADAGASVMVNARQALRDAETVVHEIEAAGGAAAAMTADVGDPDAATALVAATVERFGRLDMLVNNASVRREIGFADLDYQEWREHSGYHARRRLSLQPCGAAAPDGFGPGAIVNIGGLSSHTGAPRRAHVIAAKAGLVGLTRALAHELAPLNVTVNCVAPGLIDTARDGPRARASQVPRVPGRPQGEARRHCGARAVSLRPRCALHHRSDHSREWWPLYGIGELN